MAGGRLDVQELLVSDLEGLRQARAHGQSHGARVQQDGRHQGLLQHQEELGGLRGGGLYRHGEIMQAGFFCVIGLLLNLLT